MRSAALSALVALLLGITTVCGTALAQTVDSGSSPAPSGPVFVLGFKALADQIPDVVGEPLEDEHPAANGDSLQPTTRGLMVWRKSDNWTAFTDGATTWINGPFGVQSRGNEEMVPWEVSAAPVPSDESEITLFDRRGIATAYIAVDDENTIYLWTGEPVAYLYEDHVYGFNGKHLGWFQEGIVWDYEGISVGFTPQSRHFAPREEPAKLARLPQPPRWPREAPPPEPPLTKDVYTEPLPALLKMGQQP